MKSVLTYVLPDICAVLTIQASSFSLLGILATVSRTPDSSVTFLGCQFVVS